MLFKLSSILLDCSSIDECNDSISSILYFFNKLKKKKQDNILIITNILGGSVGDDYFSKGDIFTFELLIEKSKETKLSDFFQDKKTMMDAAIKVLGPNRRMAGESIPIISYGSPKETQFWTDFVMTAIFFK